MDKESADSAAINVIIYFICVFCFLFSCFAIGGNTAFLLGLSGYIISFYNASIIYTLSALKNQ
jgi:hypothetical protein